ncbi:MAG: hypothetical protein WAM09_15525 [Anaerolineales bacterium]|jgi:hypothetical protein
MMDQKDSYLVKTYHIKVKETLDHHITDWFGNLTLIPQENGETLLVGSFTDQPALRGFLEQLWNLNITILSVECIKGKNP